MVEILLSTNARHITNGHYKEVTYAHSELQDVVAKKVGLVIDSDELAIIMFIYKFLLSMILNVRSDDTGIIFEYDVLKVTEIWYSFVKRWIMNKQTYFLVFINILLFASYHFFNQT